MDIDTTQNDLNPAQWVEAHGDYLYRFALMRLRDQTRVEDAVQETFLAALRSRDSFSGRSTVRTWLTGILKNKILDQYRASSREVNVTSLDESAESIDDLYGAWGHLKSPAQSWPGTPREAFEQEEFWVQMSACLAKLPPRQAAVFTMREMDDMSSEEICKVLGISSTNYWVLLHRGRVALRHCLEIHWFKKD